MLVTKNLTDFMKLPLSWIKDWIDIELPPSQIAKMLTMAGIEVEGSEEVGIHCEGVVVAKVLEVLAHPNADNLCIAKVTDGSDTFQVICGAPNCRVGLKTALAKIGSTLMEKGGESFTIKKVKLRGVESFGMLCSGKELGISEEEDGIIEFSDHIDTGLSVNSLYGDTVFEISLTPNLGHCASVLGVSRELSAATGAEVKYPSAELSEMDFATSDHVSVFVQDSEKCPRYACRLIFDVQIGSSPDWMQKRLILSGMRPVNAVVDITNYVLLELGHPLHAFDFDKVSGGVIEVRPAPEGTAFVTLDGKTRTLQGEDLMICDKEKPLAIAGVMGGEISEVGENTKRVLIESAYFQPQSIRRTSKRMNLSSEASKRFERGADPNQVLFALDRVCFLINKYCGGNIAQGLIDCKKSEFAKTKITCRISQIHRILGARFSLGEIESIFKKLEIDYRFDGNDTFYVEVPTYRHDLKEEIDLIEEVARIYGYDHLKNETVTQSVSDIPSSPLYKFEKEFRNSLLSEGLQECITCDLIGPSALEILQGNSVQSSAMIEVLNPTSREQSIMRMSMLPGLLQTAKHNWDFQNQNLSCFEIGKIHFKENDSYRERLVCGILLSGKKFPHHWDVKPGNFDFYDLKGIVENIFKLLNISECSFQSEDFSIYHPGIRAAIRLNELTLGSIGQVHPAICRRLDFPQKMFFAELDLYQLFSCRLQKIECSNLPKYPSSTRDLTVSINEDVSVGKLMHVLESMNSKIIESVMLRDIFQSSEIGIGKKNVTVRVIYRDNTQTISQEEVEKEHSRVLQTLQQFL